MTSRAKIGAICAAAALVLGGSYATADSLDLAPGFLTLKPPLPRVQPFPNAPKLHLEPSARAGFKTESDIDSGIFRDLLRQFSGDYRLKGTKFSVWVGDASGDELASLEPETALPAASTTKLLTATATMSQLGSSARARTLTAWDAKNRKLYLIAGGDMLLGAGTDALDSAAGYAGLQTLAADTVKGLANAQSSGGKSSQNGKGKKPRANVLQEKPYSLVLDTSWFGTETRSKAWKPDNYQWAGLIQGMGINTGKIHPDQWGYQPDPARTVGDAFAAALGTAAGAAPQSITTEKSGLATTENLDPTKPLPAVGKAQNGGKPTIVGIAQGAPLSQVARVMLKESDNTLAETLGRLVALHRGSKPAFADAGAAVMQSVQDLGVDLGTSKLAGCSGLSYDTHISARVLADVVRVTADPKHPELHTITANLPVAAVDGTLKDSYGNTPAAGILRGKTGTLGISNALAGTFVRNNEVFFYGLVISGYPEGGGGQTIGAKQMLFQGLLGGKTEFSSQNPKEKAKSAPASPVQS